jgi:hypothetical protein
MDRFWKYKFDHVIFWIATVGFHSFTKINLISKVGFGQFVLEVIIRNGLLAILIYANLLILIPKYANQKKIILNILLLLTTIGLYVGLKNAHDVYLNGYVFGDESRRSFFYNTFYNFSIALFYLAFSVTLHLSKAWYFQRELIHKMEVEKLSSN